MRRAKRSRKKRKAVALDPRAVVAAHQRLMAPLAADASVTANPYVIPTTRTKWGPRRYAGKRRATMEAIFDIYWASGLPERVTPKVVREVSKKLGGRYQVSRQTVERALADMRARNG